MQHRGAGFLPKLDRALRVEYAAVARVGIREHRHARHAADAPDVLEHLGLREHAEVGWPATTADATKPLT